MAKNETCDKLFAKFAVVFFAIRWLVFWDSPEAVFVNLLRSPGIDSGSLAGRYDSPTVFVVPLPSRTRICRPFKETRNRFPAWPVRQPYFSYRPVRLHRLAKSIPRNRFLGSLNVYKYGLWMEDNNVSRKDSCCHSSIFQVRCCIQERLCSTCAKNVRHWCITVIIDLLIRRPYLQTDISSVQGSPIWIQQWIHI